MSEDAAQLHLAGASRTAGFAFAPCRLSAGDRHARAIHLDIEYRSILSEYLRKLELYGAGDLGLFVVRDVGADRLGFAFHRLRRQLHSSQLVEQRAAAIERRLGADQRCHAAYARRILRPFNVQLLVARRAAGAAAIAVIIRPFDDDFAQHCDDLLAAAAGQARLFATSAQLSRFARLLLVQERLDQPRAG